jgi:hypothetical protein
MNQITPIITPEEKRAGDTVRAIKELKGALVRLTSAKFFIAHVGNMNQLETDIKKNCDNIHAMIDFLDKVYKANRIIYTNVRKMYDSMEIVMEKTNE